MIKRLLLLTTVALGLAPGTWLRSQIPEPVRAGDVLFQRLPLEQGRIGAVDVLGVWRLTSDDPSFGSYSALAATGPGTFLAVSDRGQRLSFAFGGNRWSVSGIGRYDKGSHWQDKFATDVEALTRDPDTGTLWAAFEGMNAIERRDAGRASPETTRPDAMADWGGNSGPEAMARLADGSFLVIGEGASGWLDRDFPLLVFADDPVTGVESEEYRFRAPEGFRPTDMSVLPDGRVIVLIRRVAIGIPPYFETALLVADPAEIASGAPLEGRRIATFAPPFPSDNYEGLAVEPGDGYPVTLTMISDDNDAVYQRTLLARFRWDGSLPD